MRSQSFDGSNIGAVEAVHRQQASPTSIALDVYRAGAAIPFATTKLGAGEALLLAQKHQQRSVVPSGWHRDAATIYSNFDSNFDWDFCSGVGTAALFVAGR